MTVVGLVASMCLFPASPGHANDVLMTRFRVLRPDGSPAAGAHVLTTTYLTGLGYFSTVGPDGWAIAALPLADRNVQTLLPQTRLIDTFIQVLDGYQDDDDGNLLLLTARLNAGDPDLPATSTSGVEGETFTMLPMHLDMYRGDGNGDRYEDCESGNVEHPEDVPVWKCLGIDQPVRNLPMPIAHNYGAGKDMTTEITVTHTKFMSTSIAAEVGIEGSPVEVHGKHSVANEREREVNYTWHAIGGGENRLASIITDWIRQYTFTCYTDPITGWWGCTPDYVISRPADTVGLTYSGLYGFHDGARDPHTTTSYDCTRPNDGKKDDSAGTTKSLSYNFAASADPKWGQFSLHSSIDFTGETKTTVKSKYTWDVTGDEYRWHYLYVPNGLLGNWGDHAGETCPEGFPGAAYTAASDADLRNPPVEPIVKEAGEVSAPRPVIICDKYPEKCGGVIPQQ